MKREATGMGGGMMRDMMKNMTKGMGSMPEMCRTMMEQTTGTEAVNVASFATPEIKGLFEEWVKVLEEEIMAFVREKERTNLSDIAEKLKISEESALFFIGKLARERKVTLGEIQVSG